jgi:hypothetical protein
MRRVPFFMLAAMALVKDTTTGQIVEFIGHHDVDFAMVRATDGRVYYPQLSKLLFFEPGAGTSTDGPQPQKTTAQKAEDEVPVSVIPPETRLNLNAASAEQLVSLKGIGYATAKKIIELRNSMTGERFKNLDQLRGIERVDWDEVLKEDQFYIG